MDSSALILRTSSTSNKRGVWLACIIITIFIAIPVLNAKDVEPIRRRSVASDPCPHCVFGNNFSSLNPYGIQHKKYTQK